MEIKFVGRLMHLQYVITKTAIVFFKSYYYIVVVKLFSLLKIMNQLFICTWNACTFSIYIYSEFASRKAHSLDKSIP